MAAANGDIVGIIKLQIPAGKANPSPPVGPALGQRGVNIMEFCKAFNDRTKDLEPGLVVPVVIRVRKNNKFDFDVKSPPVSILLKRELNLKKGSSTPNTNKVASITRAQLEKLAQVKQPDLTAADLDAAVRTLAGTARSMGVTVEDL